MIAGLDIWRTAKQLVDWKGQDAEVHASERAEELFAEGDRDGHAVWLRIGEAVRQLLSDGSDSPRH